MYVRVGGFRRAPSAGWSLERLWCWGVYVCSAMVFGMRDLGFGLDVLWAAAWSCVWGCLLFGSSGSALRHVPVVTGFACEFAASADCSGVACGGACPSFVLLTHRTLDVVLPVQPYYYCCL